MPTREHVKADALLYGSQAVVKGVAWLRYFLRSTDETALVLSEGVRGGEHDGHDATGRWPRQRKIIGGHYSRERPHRCARLRAAERSARRRHAPRCGVKSLLRRGPNWGGPQGRLRGDATREDDCLTASSSRPLTFCGDRTIILQSAKGDVDAERD